MRSSIHYFDIITNFESDETICPLIKDLSFGLDSFPVTELTQSNSYIPSLATTNQPTVTTSTTVVNDMKLEPSFPTLSTVTTVFNDSSTTNTFTTAKNFFDYPSTLHSQSTMASLSTSTTTSTPTPTATATPTATPTATVNFNVNNSYICTSLYSNETASSSYDIDTLNVNPYMTISDYDKTLKETIFGDKKKTNFKIEKDFAYDPFSTTDPDQLKFSSTLPYISFCPIYNDVDPGMNRYIRQELNKFFYSEILKTNSRHNHNFFGTIETYSSYLENMEKAKLNIY